VDAVEAACQTALDAGLRSADTVLNILSRQNEPDELPDCGPLPPHLQLRVDPVAASRACKHALPASGLCTL